MHPHLTAKDIERFWAKVERRSADDCWPWIASIASNGYGQFSINRRPYGAHRVAYLIAYDHWNTGGRKTHICHRCDNPICCNPAHLFPGTALENIMDSIAKGRHQIPSHRFNGKTSFTGESNGRSILNEHQVRSILESMETVSALAQCYGVSEVHIRQIKRGARWKHLSRP